MPKTETISVLYNNFDVTIQVPATYDEGDRLVGQIGGVLDGFISDCTARNFLPRLYKDVSSVLEGKGYKRLQTNLDKPKEKPIFESHIAHVGRIHESGDDALKESIGVLLQASADVLPFYAKGERQGGSGRISQGAMDSANNFFAQGDDVVETIVSQIETLMPSFKVQRDSENAVTPEALARGIQALEKHYQKTAKAQAAAALSANKPSL